MSTSPDRLEVIYRTPDELEAAMLAGVLEDHGIKATTYGGYTSGWRAEAPGNVCVLVAQIDATKACELLTELPRSIEIDWGQIDFNDSSEVDEPAVSDSGEPSAAPRFRHPLSALLIVQAVLCVGLAGYRALLGGSYWVLPALFLTLLSLAITGTVLIASDPARARRIWRPIGLLFAVAIIAGILYPFLWEAINALLQ